MAAYVHDNVAPYLIGKDPRDIELHDRTLGSVYVGARNSGAEVRGNSAVNIALWDIFGQAWGAAVAAARGQDAGVGAGLQHLRRLRACAGDQAARLFERTEDWSLKPGDAAEGPYEDLACVALRRRRAGEEPRVRRHPGDEDLAVRHRGRGLDGARGFRSPTSTGRWSRSRRSATRSGAEMEVMVELHGLWTLPPALRIAEALRRV